MTPIFSNGQKNYLEKQLNDQDLIEPMKSMSNTNEMRI